MFSVQLGVCILLCCAVLSLVVFSDRVVYSPSYFDNSDLKLALGSFLILLVLVFVYNRDLAYKVVLVLYTF